MACKTIDLSAMTRSIEAALNARGIDNVGFGLGSCYVQPMTTWDDKQLSIGIHDWKDANATLAIIADTLQAWDAAQSLGVSIEGIPCTELL